MLSLPFTLSTSQHWEDDWTLIVFHMRMYSRWPELSFLMVTAASLVTDMAARLYLVLPWLMIAQLSILPLSIPSPTPTFLIFFSLFFQS